MTKLLGAGGESVVIWKDILIKKVQTSCAIRLSEIKESGTMREIAGIPVEVDVNKTNKALYVPDMVVDNLDHKNVVKYLDNTLEIIDDKLHHLAGNFLHSNSTRFLAGPNDILCNAEFHTIPYYAISTAFLGIRYIMVSILNVRGLDGINVMA